MGEQWKERLERIQEGIELAKKYPEEGVELSVVVAIVESAQRMRAALEEIAGSVRWGIEYRYIARDAIEGDPSIDLDHTAGVAFDRRGEAVMDYGPEHEEVKKGGMS